jgi:hypothetical protein
MIGKIAQRAVLSFVFILLSLDEMKASLHTHVIEEIQPFKKMA